ncbi:MAG: hypothetical protein KC591_02985, partial [Gemmatimonadetes bacterium]|nr:hypothetical protein [Gemmatimonadota bacterium]
HAARDRGRDGQAGGRRRQVPGALTMGWLKRRPWVWVVILSLVVLAVNVAFVVIATKNAPEMLIEE